MKIKDILKYLKSLILFYYFLKLQKTNNAEIVKK